MDQMCRQRFIVIVISRFLEHHSKAKPCAWHLSGALEIYQLIHERRIYTTARMQFHLHTSTELLHYTFHCYIIILVQHTA